MSWTIIGRGDCRSLLAAAGAGNAKALAYSAAIDPFCRRIAGRGRAAPLCLTCDRRLSGRMQKALIGLLHALRDDATRCLVFGVCDRCAARHGSRDALAGAVLPVLGRVFPDLGLILAAIGSARRA